MSISPEQAQREIDRRLRELSGGLSGDAISEEQATREIRERRAQLSLEPTDSQLAVASGVGSLGPPLEKSVRFAIGAAETFPEKVAALRKFYPEGELYVVRGQPVTVTDRVTAPMVTFPMQPPQEIQRQVEPEAMLFRKSVNAPWGRVNPSGFEFGDVLEFVAPDFGTYIGETIAGLYGPAGPVVRHITDRLKTALKLGAGAVAGDVAQEGIEALAGFQLEDPWDEVLPRSFVKGAMSGGSGLATAAAGASAARLGGGARNVVIGDLSPEALEAMRASERLGLEGEAALTTGQLTAHPGLQRLETLAEQIIRSVSDHKKNQQRFLTGKLTELANEGERARFMLDINKAHQDLVDTTMAELGRLTRPGVDYDLAGHQMQKVYSEYEKSSKSVVDEAYRVARAQQEPSFDLRTPLDDNGTMLREEAAEQIAMLRMEFPQVFEQEGGEQVVEIASDVPLKDQGEALAVLRILTQVARLPDVPDTVMSTPTIPGQAPRAVQPIDMLRNFRSNLSYLSIPEQPGRYSPANRAAAIVASRLSELMDNPVAGNTDLYKKANAFARARYQTLEDVTIARLAKTKLNQRPADVVAAATAPSREGNFRSLAMLRSIATAEQWQSVENAWTNEVIKRAKAGESIPKMMDELDQKSLDILMSRADQAAFRKVGDQFHRYTTGPVQDALAKQSRTQATIESLVTSNSTRAIDDLARSIRGADARAQRSFKAALWDWAMNDMQKMGTKGVMQITDESAQQTINKIRKSGLDQFFQGVDEIEMLRSLPLVANFIRTVADTGASMSGAQVMQAARNPFTPSGLVAWGHILEMYTTGRAMVNPKVRNFLLGQATRQRPPRSARAMPLAAAYLATTASDLEAEGMELRAQQFRTGVQ